MFSLVDCYVAFTMILALVGWSRAALNRDSTVLRRANEAVCPFYIVHQTITVLLGYAWIGWRAPFAVKFAALFAGTFLGSWRFYEAVAPPRHADPLRDEARVRAAGSPNPAAPRQDDPKVRRAALHFIWKHTR